MTGLIVVIAVLVAATAFGLVRRHRDGRFRLAGAAVRPGATPPPVTSTTMDPAAHYDAPEETARRDVILTQSPVDGEPAGLRISDAPEGPDDDLPRLTADDLGAPLGQRATLVQFSTVFCQPCRVARQVLDAVARDVPGVVHVDVDAESHLDLVRRYQVTRTPTVLLLDPRGAVAGRATGAPRRAQVLAALASVVPDLPAS